MERKERVAALDYVRVLAMLGVIAIHVTGSFVYAQSSWSLWGMAPGFLLNQVVRFAVPLFMILSGLSLGFVEAGSWAGFLRSRLLKQLPPYLVWSLVYWFFYHRGTAAGLGSALLWGTAAVHLYFIVIVFQFYLFYPPLKRAADRWPGQTLLAALALSLVIQQTIERTGSGFLPNGLPLWELLPTWLFYFVLGMVLGRVGLSRLGAWCGKSFFFLLVLTAGYALLYARDSAGTGNLDSVKVRLFLYAPLALLVFLGLGWRCRDREGLNRAVVFLARRSQSVFFCHILVLELLRRAPVLTVGVRGMLLTFLLLIPLSVVLAWGVDTVFQKRPRPS